MTRICIVDDESDFTWMLETSLRLEGYNVVTAQNGSEALKLMRSQMPDLVILDIIMPGLDGLEVCRQMREDPGLATLPVLFLTAKTSTMDTIQGFTSGGDMYLTKPFKLVELKARIRVLLRRNRPVSNIHRHGQVQVGKLVLDLETHCVQIGDRQVTLTKTEFKLLHCLMKHPNQVFTNAELRQVVYNHPDKPRTPNSLRWLIHMLRTKIEPLPSQPIYIRNLANHGYILFGQAETSPDPTF